MIGKKPCKMWYTQVSSEMPNFVVLHPNHMTWYICVLKAHNRNSISTNYRCVQTCKKKYKSMEKKRAPPLVKSFLIMNLNDFFQKNLFVSQPDPAHCQTTGCPKVRPTENCVHYYQVQEDFIHKINLSSFIKVSSNIMIRMIFFF